MGHWCWYTRHWVPAATQVGPCQALRVLLLPIRLHRPAATTAMRLPAKLNAGPHETLQPVPLLPSAQPCHKVPSSSRLTRRKSPTPCPAALAGAGVAARWQHPSGLCQHGQLHCHLYQRSMSGCTWSRRQSDQSRLSSGGACQPRRRIGMLTGSSSSHLAVRRQGCLGCNRCTCRWSSMLSCRRRSCYRSAGRCLPAGCGARRRSPTCRWSSPAGCGAGQAP